MLSLGFVYDSYLSNQLYVSICTNIMQLLQPKHLFPAQLLGNNTAKKAEPCSAEFSFGRRFWICGDIQNSPDL